jgi:hypothetical protein
VLGLFNPKKDKSTAAGKQIFANNLKRNEVA